MFSNQDLRTGPWRRPPPTSSSPSLWRKRGGKLVPGTPQRAKDKSKAVAVAERMTDQYAGIVALEECSDPEQDIYAEPTIVRVVGRIPDEMADALAAA